MIGFAADPGEFIGSLTLATNVLGSFPGAGDGVKNGSIGLVSDNFNQALVAAVPEPDTLGLLGALLGLHARRTRKKTAADV